MKMQSGAIRAFPKFASFVSCQIPNLAKNERVLRAIQGASGQIPRRDIVDALVWGSLPWVLPADLDDISGRHIPRSDNLEIHYLRILEFEAGGGIVRAPNGQVVHFVCVVLLHELTHWTDEHDGKRNTEEAGSAFERTVWGGSVNPITYLDDLGKRFGSWNDVVRQRGRK
jgi:hypothetical protein